MKEHSHIIRFKQWVKDGKITHKQAKKYIAEFEQSEKETKEFLKMLFSF